MSDPRNAPPTGFVATCRCGVVVGAMDYIRSDRREAGRLLGQWLHNGCTIEPRFTGAWNVSIEPCRCIRGGTEMVTPPAEGEVGELVAALKGDAACIEAGQHDLCSSTADQLTRAADLLQQQAAELATLRRQAGPPVEGEAWSVAGSLRRRSAQNPMGSADPTLLRAAELLERLAGELVVLQQEHLHG